MKEKATLHYQYKDDSGTINEISSEIKIEQKSNKKSKTKEKINFDKDESKEVLETIINIAKKYTKNNNQFIILAKDMSGIVYFYVDTNKSYILPLILPPYQKDESDIGFLSQSTDFLYSFIVKNHVVPIIKSPFTSSYRLFSTFSSALLTFSPNISENYYKETIKNNEMMNIDDFNKFLDEDLGTKEYKAKVKILIDGEDFFNDLFESFKSATHSVFIQTYIFKTDDFATMFANTLKEYSKNVDIRVLVDYIGSIKTKNPSKDLAYQNYTLPKDIIKFLEEDSNVKVRVHPDTWITSDHRKIFLIDRKKAYLGGMNIANEYRYTWHDLMVSLEGPIVSKLVKNFYKAWSFAGLGGDFAVAYRSLFTKSKRPENKETSDMINVRILNTGATDYEIYDAQIEAIRRAKQRIYIENPYFSEYSLIEELVNAKKRGVDVKIIFPEINDLVISDKLNLKIANYLIENDIEVYLYPKMTHAKAAIYDNWACLGSANFNKLSMFKNREINIAFYDDKLVNELLNKLFIPDIQNSKRYRKQENITLIYYLV
jgi:cardiolipin synthase